MADTNARALRPREKFQVAIDRPTYKQVPTPLTLAVAAGLADFECIGLYAILDGYHNRTNGLCDPSLWEISRATGAGHRDDHGAAMGLSIPTIRKYLAQMVAIEIIQITPPPANRRSQQYILRYAPRRVPQPAEVSRESHLHAKPVPSETSCESSHANPDRIRKLSKKPEEKKASLAAPAAESDSASPKNGIPIQDVDDLLSFFDRGCLHHKAVSPHRVWGRDRSWARQLLKIYGRQGAEQLIIEFIEFGGSKGWTISWPLLMRHIDPVLQRLAKRGVCLGALAAS